MRAPSRVRLYPQPADMRCGFDGLCALLRDLGLDPSRGHYLFANRAKNRVKVLYSDASGLVVLAKRLKNGGAFAIPFGGRRVEMTADELEELMSGIEPSRSVRRGNRRQAA